MYREKYEEQGFVVIPQAITAELAHEIAESVLDDVFAMVYRDEPKKPSRRSDLGIRMLADTSLRRKHLNNPDCVWMNGNSRDPIISKSSGMVNLCFNPKVREHVHFNPSVYQHIAELYGTERIAYLHGPDRVSVKVSGTRDMALHLDHNLFYRLTSPGLDGRFDERVQSFVCGSVPTDVPWEVSGTVALVPYFHHYFSLAREFFHPKRGWLPLTDKKGPFHKLGKEFLDSLDEFNLFVRDYTPVYHALVDGIPREEIQGRTEIIDFASKHRIPVPKQPYTLAATPIACEPGDLVCFNQKIPHRNLRNQSKTPRIVFYVRLFKVPDNWYGSHEHNELMERIEQGVTETELRKSRNNSMERDIFGRNGSYHSDVPEQMEFAEKLLTLRPY